MAHQINSCERNIRDTSAANINSTSLGNVDVVRFCKLFKEVQQLVLLTLLFTDTNLSATITQVPLLIKF